MNSRMDIKALWQEEKDYTDALISIQKNTLERLKSLIKATDTVLLSDRDLAKGIEAMVSEVTTITSLKEMPHGTYDVLMIPSSFLLQEELYPALKRLSDASARQLFIIGDGSVSYRPIHEKLIDSIWKRGTSQPSQRSVLILGALWEIGIPAEVSIVYEVQSHQAETPLQLAESLAPEGAGRLELLELTTELIPHMIQRTGGWEYTSKHPVEIISWDREAAR